MRVSVSVKAAAMALCATAALSAQPAPDGQRVRLIEQAMRASDAGNHAQALDLFQQAGRGRMTPGLRMLLAQEHNALDHTLLAFDFATHCQREAQADAALPERARVLQGCAALVTALRRRVGVVVVQVPGATRTGLHVRVHGSELTPAAWGSEYPVPPGTVVVEANAADGSAFRREVQVAAGGTQAVEVVLVTPTLVVQPPAPVVTATVATGGSDPLRALPRDRDRSPGPGIGPWVLVGAGAVALVGGGVFFGLASGAASDRDAACHAATSSCDPAAQIAQDRVGTFSVLTYVAAGVGAAAVVGGLVWYATARPSTGSSARAGLRLDVTPTSGGAAVFLGGSL